MTPEAGTTREDLFKELDAATAEFEKTRKIEDDARRVHISARNRLADAQKKVDEYMGKLRADAPLDSDWRNKLNRERAAASDL